MCKCDFLSHRNIQMICSAAFHRNLFLLHFANESNGRVHWRISNKKKIYSKSQWEKNSKSENERHSRHTHRYTFSKKCFRCCRTCLINNFSLAFSDTKILFKKNESRFAHLKYHNWNVIQSNKFPGISLPSTIVAFSHTYSLIDGILTL